MSKAEGLAVIRACGRGRVRKSLEALVNLGSITLDDARKVWHDAFGGKLIAVPSQTIHVSI